MSIINNPHTPKFKTWQILFAIALLWLATILLSRAAPEWDNMEELVWASSFELGYQKHPPLPTWLMYPLTLLVGKAMWLPFALGFLFVFTAQMTVFKLFTKVCDQAIYAVPSYAPLVLILTGSPIIYFTVRGGDFNHNSAQLWSIAVMFYVYYCAWISERSRSLSRSLSSTLRSRPSTLYWIYWGSLGAATGLAMLSKYSVLIQIAVLLGHFVWTKRFKRKEAWQGVGLSLFIFVIVMAPHLFWLYQQTLLGQGPIFYAQSSMQETSSYLTKMIELLFGFFLTQVYRISPVLLSLWMVYELSKKWQGSIPPPTQVDLLHLTWWSRLRKEDREFLLFFALGPTVVAMLIGIIFGQKIEAKWAFTFYLGIGFLASFFARELNIQQLVIRILGLHLIFALIFGLVTGPVADFMGKQGRGNFPSEKLAQAIQSRWQENPSVTGGQNISWIAGDTWTIGHVMIHDPVSNGRHIKAWIEADDIQSPWLTPADRQKPLLILINQLPNTPGGPSRPEQPAAPRVMELFNQATVKGEVSIPWTTNPQARPLKVSWAILPGDAK